MNRKAAAICILFFVVVAAALSVAALNPAPSTPQTGSFSGSASNEAGESVTFNVTASQEWLSEWGQGSWYVGGIVRTKTHYAHSIVMDGQNLQNGSGHWKIQFRGSKGATQSVRWISEQQNKYFGPTYTDALDEQISTLATALSFSTANGSVSTVVFQAYVEIWVTGAITGQQLYAHSTTWENFTSNQISYVAVSELTTWTKATAVTYLNGYGGSNPSDIESQDSNSITSTLENVLEVGQLWVDFTFSIPSGATEIRTQVRFMPGMYDLASGLWYLRISPGSSYDWLGPIWGTTLYGNWYTKTSNWVSSSSYRYSDGHVYVAFCLSVPWDGFWIFPPTVNIDYIWLQYKTSASWLDDANAVSTVVTFLTVVMAFCLVVIEIWRRRQAH